MFYFGCVSCTEFHPGRTVRNFPYEQTKFVQVTEPARSNGLILKGPKLAILSPPLIEQFVCPMPSLCNSALLKRQNQRSDFFFSGREAVTQLIPHLTAIQCG